MMKLKKIFAGMAASALAATMLSAVSASANDAYIGAILGYKDSTEIDATTGEPFANADAGSQFFLGQDNNPADVVFNTQNVDLVNGGQYTVSVEAPTDPGFNATNSITVLGLYIKMSDDEMAAAGIENNQKNIAGAVSEDEGDPEEQIPVDITIDDVKFDGESVGQDWNSNYGAYVMGGELKVEFVNIWNGDISDNAFMEEKGKTTTAIGSPKKTIEMTFTVTPKAGAGDDTSSADDSSAADDSTASSTDSAASSSAADSSSASSSSAASTTSSAASSSSSKAASTTTSSKAATTTSTAATSSAASDATEAPEAGAAAGIALALAAVAGAAVVVTRKRG